MYENEEHPSAGIECTVIKVNAGRIKTQGKSKDVVFIDAFDVVAIGELLIDFTETGTNSDGYPIMQANPGGAPGNFLAALSVLGAKTALLAKVGSDMFGNMLIDTLRKAGINDQGIVQDTNYFTTLAFVRLNPKTGDRQFSFCRKPGADTKLSYDECNLDLIERARCVHFGTLSLTNDPARSATQKVIEYSKVKGKIITFDPNLREPLWNDLSEAKDMMLWGLKQADIVKISDYETEFLWNLSPEDGAKKLINDYDVKAAFVTCGENGSWYAARGCLGHVNSLQGLKIVDTTGAGDIFFGSAIWKLLQTGRMPNDLDDASLREASAFANAMAGLSTEKYGAIPSIPCLSDVERALAGL